jgi:hypothetical protein
VSDLTSRSPGRWHRAEDPDPVVPGSGPGRALFLYRHDWRAILWARYALGDFYFPDDVLGTAFFDLMPKLRYIGCEAVAVLDAFH